MIFWLEWWMKNVWEFEMFGWYGMRGPNCLCMCIYGFNVKSLDYGDWWLNVGSVVRFVSNGIRECWNGTNEVGREIG